MRPEKIVTIYPTVVKPGLMINHFMPPDPVAFSEGYPSRCSFYLTSLMYFEHGKKYITELDVSLNGESVLPDSKRDENSLETFMFSPISDTSVMVGSSLLVRDINLPAEGTYDVFFRIYEDIDGELSSVLDEKACAIISVIPIRI